VRHADGSFLSNAGGNYPAAGKHNRPGSRETTRMNSVSAGLIAKRAQ